MNSPLFPEAAAEHLTTGSRLFTACCWNIMASRWSESFGILSMQFIYSMLSARTKTETSHEVLRNLRARFGDWETLRDAPVSEIEDAHSRCYVS